MKRHLVGLSLVFAIAVADPPKKVPAPAAAAKAIARVNELRKIAGLDPVSFNAEASAGCLKHAKYLVANEELMWSKDPTAAHDEEEDRAGFSEEGRTAGKSAVIAWREPVKAVDDWFDSFFHRIPLLDPRLNTIAVGDVKGTSQGWVSVVDVRAGIGKDEKWPKDLVVLYPADGQRAVPTKLGLELPSPIPQDPDGEGGYPVTASFPPDAKVTEVKATLRNMKTNQVVDSWLSTPEKPADARYQRNSVCLIAKSSLSGGAAFRVSIEAKVDDVAWTKTWSFSTGK